MIEVIIKDVISKGNARIEELFIVTACNRFIPRVNGRILLIAATAIGIKSVGKIIPLKKSIGIITRRELKTATNWVFARHAKASPIEINETETMNKTRNNSIGFFGKGIPNTTTAIAKINPTSSSAKINCPNVFPANQVKRLVGERANLVSIPSPLSKTTEIHVSSMQVSINTKAIPTGVIMLKSEALYNLFSLILKGATK